MQAGTENVGAWLGEKTKTELDLIRLIRRGLPVSVFSVFQKRGLTAAEFYSLVIPARTLKHRKARTENLSQDESDKAYRAARVFASAEQAFGSRNKALAWMRKPKTRFGGETPIEMLRTEAGARLVEEMLVQIDEGMFA
jgi:putative toxin-antitoxin system antitoxin component (TIGR02293 family)